MDIATRAWCPELFELCGLNLKTAPELVATGTQIGTVQGSLRNLPAFKETRLIAPACHDTASAVAGIPMSGDDWAYISSGTWSLVGALIEEPIKSTAACAGGFTNLGAAGDRMGFHKNVNGMWLLKQMLNQLCPEENPWPMAEAVAAAELVDKPEALLEVDDPELWAAGNMASRINDQLRRTGFRQSRNTPPRCPCSPALSFIVWRSDMLSCFQM